MELEFKPIEREADLHKVAGQLKLSAAKVGDSIVAVKVGVGKCYYILCYIPADDILVRIEPDIRNKIIEQYVDKKIIPAEFGKILKEQM